MPIISVRDLVVEYDGRRVLNGLNLDIEHGETMVLLGGSGSGKSTLLRQIIGLERPKSGSVHINGMDITRCSKSELKKIQPGLGTYQVYGVYDLVVEIRAESDKELKDIIFTMIRSLKHVKSTLTLSVVE